MRLFYTFLSVLFILLGSLNANMNASKSIDNDKKVIQIGMFTNKLNIIDCVAKYKDKYELFTKSYKQYKIIYAININKNDLSTTFKDIKNHYVDAFINNKVHFQNKQAIMKKPAMKMAKKETNRVDIIQIGNFANENYLFDTIRKYAKDNTMMIKPYQNTYVAYLMNAHQTQTKKDLKIVQKSYSDAFLNDKIHLYIQPQKAILSKPKVIEKIVEKEVIKIIEKEVIKVVEKIVYKTKKPKIKKVAVKPAISKPIDLDRLITSFENLPFAMYGRM